MAWDEDDGTITDPEPQPEPDSDDDDNNDNDSDPMECEGDGPWTGYDFTDSAASIKVENGCVSATTEEMQR